MGKFMNLSKIKEQAELIETLAGRVNDDVVRHCDALKTYCYYSLPTGVPRKTQIQADIMRLRCKLMELSKRLRECVIWVRREFWTCRTTRGYRPMTRPQQSTV